jgi:hypothetical protein
MTAALGFAVIAVALGAGLAFQRGASSLAVHPVLVLIPLFVSFAAIVAIARFARLPGIQEVPRRRQLLFGVGIVLATGVAVVSTEATLLLQWPSRGAMVVGLALGLALVGAWIERDASPPGAKIAVLLLYLAAGITALSTLMTNLPPSVFWVISAVIPAWQARRLVAKDELQAAFRLLNAATKVFVAVLTVALWLPVLLMHR